MDQNNRDQQARARAYWHANLKLVGVLLAVWFAVSYGAGISQLLFIYMMAHSVCRPLRRRP